MEERLRTAAGGRDVQYIVISDGEAILGLGDQGVGGILISAAKLIIATACGGVNPHRTLSVVLDVGTDNENLEQYELYLGIKKRRTRGKDYDEFVDKFVQSARQTFPDAYIHFEVNDPSSLIPALVPSNHAVSSDHYLRKLLADPDATDRISA